MRLNSIKLSGFKSFADATNFLLPGQLIGVVGPNGCGKSNIIDAVRWVLGESRASELRGESMQDVIFNGTNTRKPASRASVELAFDNQSHRAGGQWNQFEEIAVKRVLTRDGTSSYYINNQPVRRRDVQDVFLGTGLGPRAYAIIGQGTISRIIESKPEELRLFLEEAAGVSKYKERRRETENRLSDTRENLTRVEDILRELNANLEKLERQAEVAQRFNHLQQQAKLKQQQQWFLKRQQAHSEQAGLKQQADQATNALEAKNAELSQIQAAVETIRQAHYESGEQVNHAQGQLYQASAEVGRLEAEIRFVLEGRQRAQDRLQQIHQQSLHWAQQSEQAAEQTLNLQDQGEVLQARMTQLQTDVHDRQQRLPALEQAWMDARRQVQQQIESVNQIQQQIKVLAAEQRGLQEQSRQLEQRLERLQSDRHALAAPDELQLKQLQEQLSLADTLSEQTQAQLDELEAMVEEIEANRRTAQENSNRESGKLVELQARQQALKALQEKLCSDERLTPWLSKHGLQSLQPLWRKVHVTPGWEKALESALRERLAALEVSRLDTVKAFAADAPAARLSFYSPAAAASAQPSGGLPRLFDQLKLNDAALNGLLSDWLSGCFTTASLDEALACRDRLQAGQQVFTPQGHAVGLHSVSFYAQDSEQSGLLARAQEIENLDKQIRAQSLMAEEACLQLSRTESAAAQSAQQRTQKRVEATQAQSQAHSLNVEFLRLQQLADQVRTRQDQLTGEADELQAQLYVLQERAQADKAGFETLDIQLAQAQERQVMLEEKAELAEQQSGQERENLRLIERQTQETEFELRSLNAKLAELQRTRDTAAQQIQQLLAEHSRQQAELDTLSDTAAQAGLQDALSLKLERENLLAAKRYEYDGLTHQLRTSNEERLKIERELEPMRQRIVDAQLKEQAARLGYEQYDRFLQEAQADVAAIETSLQSGQVRLHGLQTEIDQLHREIQSLGAINLAALEEFGVASERKQFLDAQSADLNEAINTLEDAIRKIDIETRALLAQTFETVNHHFGIMFPKLFGGGTAKLVMTGDEILDSGVQVMAQPPGKKNQTIYLLSGGEKALIAIALVFAIFQLNPAPFCLLDEVDAPLDDANTERYRKLVSSMSKETQFLFISHNKITMEMAEQLIGVTMQEQGVSRIVAVDIEAAVSLVETS
ncbi:MAG: chromosome segregation protein SMC [Limnohabitans sp.]|nr:chromosome segregation protein SMC [Limnohabitans sp.]